MPVVSVSVRHFQLAPQTLVDAAVANATGQSFAGSPAVTGEGSGATLPTLADTPQLKASVDANALVSDAFTPADGEVLVVKAGTYSSTIAPGTPSGGGLTWTQRVVEAGGGFNGRFEIWTAVVGTSPGSMTITMTPAASSHHAMVVERWSGAQLAATPATGQSFEGNISAPLATITTTSANSIVSWGVYDNNSVDPTGHTYRSGATEEFVRNPGNSVGIFYFAYQEAAATGSQDFGLTVPSTAKANMAGIEVQAAGSGTAARVARAQQVIQPRKPHRAWRTTPSPTVVMAPVSA